LFETLQAMPAACVPYAKNVNNVSYGGSWQGCTDPAVDPFDA
jgi:hypothetical protein